ncbi:hypothetical protein [Comamonas terrigena]|uniref:hypothetical protein n=1 Tax=Comamonas terrigena TaxID=32013 RepID=UPI00244BE6AA|nr:hypothetical protein [Comamonas terrigena]MDH0049626.1 hypothetical protein [Comamonas terrigena]MDH0511278.1 hypothetical protein [Comamonas terrigena]MDH1091419.1 hypothetical protein [Comamonas terrigena]
MSTVIPVLPTPPQPSDTPSQFNSKAFALLGGLPEFVTKANALGAEVEQNATAAASAKTAAAASQTAAKTSETNSASSKTAAANSATAAASSQTAAKTSETNAKASETAAANSATAAASSQTAAKTSETNAKASETAAANSATAAASSQTAAKTSETNAASSKTAAANSATAAASSQTAAKTSETNSKASETASANSATAAASAATRAEDAAATNVNAVQRTAATGAALLPEGINAQRPAIGSIPAGAFVVRGSTQDAADYKGEFWDRVAATWKVIADRTWVGQQITAAVNLVKDWVDQQVGFAIIYPNGGTAASPASVAANSRYVSGNPFPGTHVLCELEILYNGVWQSPGFSGSGYQQFLSHGAQASMYGAGEIIVQTGINSVVAYSAITGGGGGIGSGVFVTSAPCRVKVWKSKGVI